MSLLAGMRRTSWTATAVTVVVALVPGGCGGDDFANQPRGPDRVAVSVSITGSEVTVSPSRLGAGPIELIAGNLTSRSQRLTLRSVSRTGDRPALEQRTGPINPGDTASLTADLAQGSYRLTTGSDAIAPATIRVGPPRAGAQDKLLQP